MQVVGHRKWYGTAYLGRFKISFYVQFCPKAYKEANRVEFEKLVQGSMFLIEYEKKFLKPLEFCPYLILNDNKKKRRFLDVM